MRRLDVEFIRQSVRSDYCGVYAAGMFLALLGRPTTRKGARSLFGLPRRSPGYAGTDLDLVAAVIRQRADLSAVRWEYSDEFVFQAVVQKLRRQLERTKLPTLIWFGAVYSDGHTRAFHIAVVVRVGPDRIVLLDPLGGRPEKGKRFNVSIVSTRQPRRFLKADGSFYSVDLNMQVGILRWRRPDLRSRRMTPMRR